MCVCFPVLTPIFQFESSRQRFASIVSYFRSLTGGLNQKSSIYRYRDSNKDKRWYPLVRIRKSKRQAHLESDDVEKPKSKAFPQENDQSHGVNATLTVGGLKGTGNFLGSRADDFAA